ncbi:NADH-quinone oxidoreductase subunit NuoE [Thermoproteota archaeon]
MTQDIRLDKIFSTFKGNKGELIPVLQAVQDEFGYLPRDAMVEIAKFTGASESRVFGVASFYAQFRLQPTGKNKICVCRGTACHVRGGPQILEEVERQLGIKEGESTPNLEYSLETVACVGCCALAPVVTINDEVHGRLSLKDVAKILPSKEIA